MRLYLHKSHILVVVDVSFSSVEKGRCSLCLVEKGWCSFLFVPHIRIRQHPASQIHAAENLGIVEPTFCN